MTHRVRWVDRRCLLEDHGDQSAAKSGRCAANTIPVKVLGQCTPIHILR
jgi:hypothetical protein